MGVHVESCLSAPPDVLPFPESATFTPLDDQSWGDPLLDEVAKHRRARLVASTLKLQAQHSNSALSLEECTESLTRLPHRDWRDASERPLMRVSLRRAAELALGREEMQVNEVELQPIVRGMEAVVAGGDRHLLTVPGTTIEIARHDIDPALARVIPPSYDFDLSPFKGGDENTFGLEFFRDVMDAAMRRIGGAWPELPPDIERFVKLLIHLPDATFRSCSADRYSGVVLLSADDGTLLDFEESLVHEYGHQILYNVMELDPLILPVAEDVFHLPWSGAERDFYGYFHAFFIYLLLVRYFERVSDSAVHAVVDQERARERAAEISRGLKPAAAELERGRFTRRGSELFEVLLERVEEATSRHVA